MVNLNITLPDELHKQLKVQAALEGRPLKELVIKALEESVKDAQQQRKEEVP
jgi:predicted HicB family RNase H-like nuclease